MVKLFNPLFSQTASGKLGDVLTFSQRKQGSQVRFQRAQKDFLSVGRVTQRKTFKGGVGWWHEMLKVEQDNFSGYAASEA